MVSDRALSRVLPRSSVVLFGDLIRVAIAIAIVSVIAVVGIYYRFQGDHLNDFRVFYYSTQAWLDGQDMYGPTPATSVPVGDGRYHDLWNMNPPHFHLLVLPFTALPLGQAMAAWVVVNVALLVCCIAAITRALNVRWTVPGALWATFASVIFSATCGLVATGQVTWIIMVPVTFAWAAAREGRWPRAALLLGTAASIKPFLGVFLLYFALRRQWKLVLLMLRAGAAWAVVGVAVFGLDAQWRWIETLRAVDWPWAPMNSSLAGFLTRVLSDNPFVPHLVDAPRLIGPLAVAGSLVLAFVTYRRLMRDRAAAAGAVDSVFAALLILALLVSPLGWIYYLWLPVGPLLALFWFSARPLGARTRAFLLVSAPGLVWPLYPFIWFRDSPWAAVSIAAIYFWTALGLWSAVVLAPERPPHAV
jgi:alpha-1,2-mannosyltransferase